MKAVIIDDEPLAREILRDYISETPELELVAEFDSAIKASVWFQHNSAEILFLDIEMPRLSGIQWLQNSSVQEKTAIVITSAYSTYVSESYELNVSDYLLKPISYDRFFRSLSRIKQKKLEVSQNNSLLIRVDKTWVLLDLESVLYIEGMGDYLKIFTPEKNFVIQETMKSFYEKLPSSLFFRVHKSYIIQRKAIERIDGNLIQFGKTSIPLSATSKEDFLNWLRSS